MTPDTNSGATPPDTPLAAACLFSGMGGLASGLCASGFSILWATDWDESAASTFRHRFPRVRFIEKDVSDLSVAGDSLPPVDLLSAGFPCQAFSQAGDRRGFDDPRGQLFFDIPRILGEFDVHLRPKLLLLENVPNLLGGANGIWFDQIQRTLRRAGYWFRRESCWAVNVKNVTSLPQDRERLFMVAAARNHFTYNPFLPPGDPLSGCARPDLIPLDDIVDRQRPAAPEEYLPSENRYYKMIAKTMQSGDSDNNIYQLRRSYVREKRNGLCPTLTANMGIGGHNVPFVRDQWGIRRLSVTEVAHLQGFDTMSSLFPDIPVQQRYRLLGNAVCVALAKVVATMCADILRKGDRREK